MRTPIPHVQSPSRQSTHRYTHTHSLSLSLYFWVCGCEAQGHRWRFLCGQAAILLRVLWSPRDETGAFSGLGS